MNLFLGTDPYHGSGSTIKLAKQTAAVQALATTKYQTCNEKRFALTTISQSCAGMECQNFIVMVLGMVGFISRYWLGWWGSCHGTGGGEGSFHGGGHVIVLALARGGEVHVVVLAGVGGGHVMVLAGGGSGHVMVLAWCGGDIVLKICVVDNVAPKSFSKNKQP